MSVFKEIKKNDGSGVSTFYRIHNGNVVQMTCDYASSTEKPQINGVTLEGNLSSADLNLEGPIEVLEIVGRKNLSIFKQEGDHVYFLKGDGTLQIKIPNGTSSTTKSFYGGTMVYSYYNPEGDALAVTIVSSMEPPYTIEHVGSITSSTVFQTIKTWEHEINIKQDLLGGNLTLFKQPINIVGVPQTIKVYKDGSEVEEEMTLPTHTLCLGVAKDLILGKIDHVLMLLPTGEIYSIPQITAANAWINSINTADAILSKCIGYDNTKTQVLKNINGVLTWIDE